MTQDLRGFVYALEPVRVKAQWQLEALQRELATAAARAAALREEAQALGAHFEAFARAARAPTSGRVDPAQAHRALAYLSDVQRQLAALAAQRSSADAQQTALQQRVAEQRLALDALDEDRERCRSEHVAERLRQHAIEADDDWLVRSSWCRRGTPDLETP